MGNILEYLIKLKADGGNVSSVANEATNELNQIDQSAKKVGSSLREAFSFNNFKSSLMSIPGMQFLMNPYTIVGSGIAAITKLGSEAEMTSVAFRNLVGDEKLAADTLAQIKEYANSTPYETMDLVGSAKMMLQFGMNTEQAVDTMKRLGDIASGDKNNMSSLALVMAQVSSQGKLQGQDWHQFVNAGFNPLQELSKMTGKTMGELQDMMSKGQIGANAVTAAIEHATNAGGQFYQNSEKLAGTTAGKFSTLLGQLADMASKAYSAIQPIVNALIDTASWLTQNTDLIAAVATAIGIATVALNAHSIAIGIATGATTLWTAAQTALNVVMSMNPIGAVVAVIGALSAGVVYCWNKFSGFRAFLITMWGTIKQFGNILGKYVIDRVSDLLSGIGELGKALAALFKGDFSGAWEMAKSAAGKMSGANATAKAFSASKDALSGVGETYKSNLKTEQAKDKKTNKVTTPSLKGSADYSNLFDDATSTGKGKKGKGTKSKTAEAITTGGTRNTSIVMNISKFFDNIQVTMMDKADTNEIETIVVQSLNRALAIATAKDR